MLRRLSQKERRTQIMEAASVLFAKKGFHRTTTKEIARKVGVSEAMVFKHFATKERLYAAILDSKAQAEDPLAEIEEMAKAKDDLGVFQGLASHYFRRAQKDPALVRLLLYSALEHHRLSEEFVENHVLKIHLFLRQYIEERVADGAFKRVNPLLAARAFLGMVSHHILAQEIFGLKRKFPLNEEESIETFVKIFLEGILR